VDKKFPKKNNHDIFLVINYSYFMIKKIISNIYQSNYLKPRVYLLSSNKSSNSGINQNSLTQNNSNEIIEDTQPGKLM
jgi:hypothetical protein